MFAAINIFLLYAMRRVTILIFYTARLVFMCCCCEHHSSKEFWATNFYSLKTSM